VDAGGVQDFEGGEEAGDVAAEGKAAGEAVVDGGGAGCGIGEGWCLNGLSQRRTEG